MPKRFSVAEKILLPLIIGAGSLALRANTFSYVSYIPNDYPHIQVVPTYFDGINNTSRLETYRREFTVRIMHKDYYGCPVALDAYYYSQGSSISGDNMNPYINRAYTNAKRLEVHFGTHDNYDPSKPYDYKILKEEDNEAFIIIPQEIKTKSNTITVNLYYGSPGEAEAISNHEETLTRYLSCTCSLSPIKKTAISFTPNGQDYTQEEKKFVAGDYFGCEAHPSRKFTYISHNAYQTYTDPAQNFLPFEDILLEQINEKGIKEPFYSNSAKLYFRRRQSDFYDDFFIASMGSYVTWNLSFPIKNSYDSNGNLTSSMTGLRLTTPIAISKDGRYCYKKVTNDSMEESYHIPLPPYRAGSSSLNTYEFEIRFNGTGESKGQILTYQFKVEKTRDYVGPKNNSSYYIEVI